MDGKKSGGVFVFPQTRILTQFSNHRNELLKETTCISQKEFYRIGDNLQHIWEQNIKVGKGQGGSTGKTEIDKGQPPM